MLQALGLQRIEQLFEEQIPLPLLLDRPLSLPGALSELDLRRHFADLAARNLPAAGMANFLGAGIYDHYVPSLIDVIIQRGEFLTAYTPYQPEMSQGTLQAIYEFQSMICNLTGMDVANASMYDGASALAEAVILACGTTHRDEAVLIGVHPEWVRVVRTYVEGLGIAVIEAPLPDGQVDPSWLQTGVHAGTAVVAVQQPGFHGTVHELTGLAAAAHSSGALVVVSANPTCLGILASPGSQGADIVVGDTQPFGLGLNFGGPLCGFFAAREKYVRQLPGRLVSRTTDTEGRIGYVLTLQTREQHIRRERATSNICTNQGLMMLASTVYMSLLGSAGLAEVADQCLQKAHYAAQRLTAIPGFSLRFPAPFFHEFLLQCPRDASGIARELVPKGIVAGLPMGRFGPEWENCLLVAVTEKRTRAEIDSFAAALAALRY